MPIRVPVTVSLLPLNMHCGSYQPTVQWQMSRDELARTCLSYSRAYPGRRNGRGQGVLC